MSIPASQFEDKSENLKLTVSMTGQMNCLVGLGSRSHRLVTDVVTRSGCRLTGSIDAILKKNDRFQRTTAGLGICPIIIPEWMRRRIDVEEQNTKLFRVRFRVQGVGRVVASTSRIICDVAAWLDTRSK